MFPAMAENMRCPFEKTILSAQCTCEMATRYSVAEQMGVNCRDDIARNNCLILLGLLRERARFALKVTDTASALAFGKEMKVMIGGLLGLQRQINPQQNTDRVHDIHALVRQAQEVYGSLPNLPYQQIIKDITAFQGKRRGRRPPR